MTVCAYCGREWKWKDTFKRLASFKNTMKCPYCKKSQFQTASSKQKTSMLIVSPSLLLPLFVMFSLSLPLLLLCYVTVFLLSPLLVKLTKEDSPLW
ncbi:hypothetical protein P6709_09780 [Jeotgalibacillus sp. ET6]|uniref:TIGR04104 family putative zinc finger protein n=1 Tax=Jeotgalibacillus sp. ET6 TaxID=3037260 RepID=UPI0024189EC2|nr:TIGR04104 family putative zinc finger protein [Jeotgalibacillus sp. ET6]MDG5472040.1 hypothetical protein [Jeotgalibacillus sp. ET6]